MQLHTFTVNLEDSGRVEMRLDAFLGAQIADISREKIKKAIQNEQCRVDGFLVRSASTKVKNGQMVELTVAPPEIHLVPEEGEVEVLWEDAHLLICNKSSDLTVHPCPSCTENTLIQRLATHYPVLLLQEGLRPGIVHRLDKDTSGLMVVALTEVARLHLAESFAERQVHKEYLALVQGVISENGEICEPIGRHPTAKVKMAIVPENKGGRVAHSAWQRLYASPSGRFSLVKVTIFTGRTHQIRVHMAHLGFPLWGDALYGKSAENCCLRQMLHAWHLSFTHPITHEACEFYLAPPSDMLDCALALSYSLQKVIITGLAGCGKSALLQIFDSLGVPTWSADVAVSKLYSIGGAGHAYFHERFGSRFMEHKNAPLQRQTLRLAMQDDVALRHEIEGVIHALVRDDCASFWEKCQEQKHAHAIAEIPLYLENGWQQREEAHIIGVSCTQETRYARLQERRQWSVEQCQSIDSWQWPEEKKMAACHTVINNNGTVEDLQRAAQALIISLQENNDSTKQDLAKYLCSLWEKPQK